MSDEPKSAEEKEAERPAVDEQAPQAAESIEQLLKDATVLDGSFTAGVLDPTFQLYDHHEARLQAEAAILEEACDIVLPEIKLVAKSIRASFMDSEPSESLPELEALCGSLPARHRQAEWLDVPAFHLDGAMNFLGAFTDAQDGDSGVLSSKAYYLLVDGRLIEVHALGTWRVTENELRDTRRTIVSTREVTAKEVVGEVSLTDLFMQLRNSLHLSSAALEGQHAPDRVARQTRFDEIVEHYIDLLKQHGEGLRRVGDKPA